MHLRRLTSLAASLLLFNFGFSPGTSACEIHGEDGASTEAVAVAHVHGVKSTGSQGSHAAHADNHGAAGDEAPCEIPSRPVCCQAIGSCTVSFALGGAEIRGTVTPAAVTIAVHSVAAPVSLAHPPEPPPPKA